MARKKSKSTRGSRAGKPAGGIKGSVPSTEGVIGPGIMKGAGGEMPMHERGRTDQPDARYEPRDQTPAKKQTRRP
jgi:hypothetical protein